MTIRTERRFLLSCLFLPLFMVLPAFLSGCGGGMGSGAAPSGTSTTSGNNPVAPPAGGQIAARVAVTVVDENDQPISGAQATTVDGLSATTDGNGKFSVSVASLAADGTPVRITVRKGGFQDSFDTVRVYRESVRDGVMSATLVMRRAAGSAAEAASAVVTNADGSTQNVSPAAVNVSGATVYQATVNVGADTKAVAFQTPSEGGKPPEVTFTIGSADGSGANAAAALGGARVIRASISYGDPSDPADMDTFPGELYTSSDMGNGQSGGALVTAGFARITLTDASGAPITQFAPGTSATIRMAVSAGTMNPDTGQAVRSGDFIPVFVFNESTGEWIVERNGDGSVKRTVVKQDNDGNLYTEFTTTHLSIFNLDFFAAECPGYQPTVRIVDENGVPVTGATISTGNAGNYGSARVTYDSVVQFYRAPANQIWTVWVTKGDLKSEVATVNACKDAKTGSADITLVLKKAVQPKCSTDAQCNDGNALTTDICRMPGLVNAACVNIPCGPTCSSDVSCDDGKATTIDSCFNPMSCQSYCKHNSCDIACVSDNQCDDFNPLTVDACSSPNTCGATCSHTACASACSTNADCNDNNPDTTDLCNNGGTCAAQCGNLEATCDLQLDKVNYVPGDTMRITFKGTNAGSSPTLCGAEAALKRGQSPATWNSFSEDMFVSIPGLAANFTQTLTKVIPFSWAGTDSRIGSDYDLYTVHQNAEFWRKGDNFNIHVQNSCNVACINDGECNDNKDTTTDTCQNANTCSASCSHVTCPVACVSGASCDDGNLLTLDVCNNAGKCNAACSNSSCTPACSSDGVCDDQNALTLDTCQSPGTCAAACAHSACTPLCINNSNCADTNPLTIDLCVSPNTCSAACTHNLCTPVCSLNSDCADTNPLTFDLCSNPGTCGASCLHNPCTPACTSNANCDDGNALTIDTCAAPGTCSAACLNTACPISCTTNSQCDDSNALTLDVCNNASTCSAACSNTACAPACTTNANCNDSNALTLDTCSNPNTCSAACLYTPCTPACTADANCNDSNALTIDTCGNPNTCSAACLFTACTPTCTTNANCDDSNALTVDTCSNPNTCSAACLFTACTPACTADANCNDSNALTADTCSNPNTCGAACLFTPCAPACTADANCNDSNSLTIDTCGNPNTCSAACLFSPCTPSCTTNANCDDSDALTTDVCLSPNTCSSSCQNTVCPVACSSNAVCDDSNALTIDVCLNPGTCSAACQNSACPIACSADGACDDGNALTIDVCLSPGLCAAACQNTACVPACASSGDCNDSNALTVDSCLNPSTCSAACQNTACAPTCTADGDCDDSNALTVDACSNPNTCSAACQNTACTPACTANGDCNDSNALTVDTCGNPNTCSAACVFTPCSPACNSNAECDDANPLTSNVCDNPGTCSASCSFPSCVTCSNNAQCDDSNSSTLDTCDSAGTCASACSHCTPLCSANATCNDSNIYTLDLCLSPGLCGANCANTLSGTWATYGVSASGGGISTTSSSSIYPSVALNLLGYPIVSWSDNAAGKYNIFVKQWNGSAWVEVGTGSASGSGISSATTDALSPSTVTDDSGYPVVTWQHDMEVYVKRWNGTAWVPLGATGTANISSSPSFNSEWPRIYKGAGDTYFVVWREAVSVSNQEIYLKYWDGSAWQQLAGSATGGGISNEAAISEEPDMALDGSGYPIVAWTNNNGGNYEMYVKRWNGSSWATMGAGSASGTGISNSTGDDYMADVIIDGTGMPVVAWQNYTTALTYEIYIKRWNGTSWVEMGAGSASGAGLSNNVGHSQYPALFNDATGNTVVIWTDRAPGNDDVYALRWNGSSWAPFTTGSTTGGGISNNSGHSIMVQLAVDSLKLPVITWYDITNGNNEIYVKKYVAP